MRSLAASSSSLITGMGSHSLAGAESGPAAPLLYPKMYQTAAIALTPITIQAAIESAAAASSSASFLIHDQTKNGSSTSPMMSDTNVV